MYLSKVNKCTTFVSYTNTGTRELLRTIIPTPPKPLSFRLNKNDTYTYADKREVKYLQELCIDIGGMFVYLHLDVLLLGRRAFLITWPLDLVVLAVGVALCWSLCEIGRPGLCWSLKGKQKSMGLEQPFVLNKARKINVSKKILFFYIYPI